MPSVLKMVTTPNMIVTTPNIQAYFLEQNQIYTDY